MPAALSSLRTQGAKEVLPREAEQNLAKAEVQTCIETKIV